MGFESGVVVGSQIVAVAAVVARRVVVIVGCCRIAPLCLFYQLGPFVGEVVAAGAGSCCKDLAAAAAFAEVGYRD